MLNVTGTSIQLTRGDTAHISVSIDDNIAGNKYELSPNDTLTFSVKRNVTDKTTLIEKKLNGTNVFHIKPNDTSGLSFGKYVYDIQLDTEDGDVYTIIAPSVFEVMKEVTC